MFLYNDEFTRCCSLWSTMSVSPMAPYSLTNSERHSPPERMKEKPTYSSDFEVYFVPLLSLHLQYQAMLSNAPSERRAMQHGAALASIARRSLQHCLILQTQRQRRYENRHGHGEYAGSPFILFGGMCRSLFVNEYGAVGDTGIHPCTRQDPSLKNN